MFVTVVTAVAVVNRDGVIVAGVKVLRGLATGCRRYRRRTGNWAFVVSPTSGRAAMPGKRNPRISSACAKPGCSINDRPFYGNEVIAQFPYLLGVSSRPIGGGIVIGGGPPSFHRHPGRSKTGEICGFRQCSKLWRFQPLPSGSCLQMTNAGITIAALSRFGKGSEGVLALPFERTLSHYGRKAVRSP